MLSHYHVSSEAALLIFYDQGGLGYFMNLLNSVLMSIKDQFGDAFLRGDPLIFPKDRSYSIILDSSLATFHGLDLQALFHFFDLERELLCSID